VTFQHAGPRRASSTATTTQARTGTDTTDHAGDVLGKFPALAGAALVLEPLTGGLTNRNYKVSASDGRRFVARFSSGKSALLGINRADEYRNARAAAEIGIGPGVVDHSPADAILLVEWIDGHTFSDADLDDEQQLSRVARACRQLHSAPLFGNNFDMFGVQLGYLKIVREHGFRLPPGFLEFMPQVVRLRELLATPADELVPCHNDLLAANIMDDGSRLWLIDYEYSGNNDACFELGNIWSEAELGPDRLEQLVSAYYGREAPDKVARARLFGLVAKYGWTLWASIQSSVSEVDFDFWSWGMDKYARAIAEFRSPSFERLINDIIEPI
jgi:thiamine kinase-like enzyme